MNFHWLWLVKIRIPNSWIRAPNERMRSVRTQFNEKMVIRHDRIMSGAIRRVIFTTDVRHTKYASIEHIFSSASFYWRIVAEFLVRSLLCGRIRWCLTFWLEFFFKYTDRLTLTRALTRTHASRGNCVRSTHINDVKWMRRTKNEDRTIEWEKENV